MMMNIYLTVNEVIVISATFDDTNFQMSAIHGSIRQSTISQI